MSQSEHTELMDLIDRTWDEMGGRGTKAEVIAHLRILLPPHLSVYLVDSGLATKVGAYLRRRNGDGLPAAPEIDTHGTHCQLELLVVDDYRYVIAQHVKRGNEARRRALAYADECYTTHGVVIDVDDPYDEGEAVAT